MQAPFAYKENVDRFLDKTKELTPADLEEVDGVVRQLWEIVSSPSYLPASVIPVAVYKETQHFTSRLPPDPSKHRETLESLLSSYIAMLRAEKSMPPEHAPSFNRTGAFRHLLSAMKFARSLGPAERSAFLCHYMNLLRYIVLFNGETIAESTKVEVNGIPCHSDPSTFPYLTLRHTMGEGSDSSVFLGVDLTTGEEVAVKVYKKVRPRKLDNKPLAFTHRNIVRTYEVSDSGCIMELCRGKTLQQLIQRQDICLTEDVVERIIVQVASALYQIHAHCYLHRDVTPTNILILHPIRCQEDLNDIVPKLSDFSLSKEVKSSGVTHSNVGTPLYMAPEMDRIQGYTNKVDIYALGRVWCALLDAVPDLCERPELVERMCDPNPERRPSAEIIVRELGGELPTLPSDMFHSLSPDDSLFQSANDPTALTASLAASGWIMVDRPLSFVEPQCLTARLRELVFGPEGAAARGSSPPPPSTLP